MIGDEPRPGYRYLAEIICMHCGRAVCHIVALSPITPVTAPANLRCKACGGPPLQSGDGRWVLVGPEPKVRMYDKVPKGRPSNATLALRAAEEARLAAHFGRETLSS